MLNKISLIVITTLALTLNVSASSDGELLLKKNNPSEVKEFMRKFRAKDKITPVVVVPSSFNSVSEDEWQKRGVNIVCYANHMLRSAYPAMLDVAKSILINKRSLEASDKCISINDILNLIPGTK